MQFSKMKLFVFTAAVLLSPCKATITHLDSANTSTYIDSNYKIRSIYNRYGILHMTQPMIGDVSKRVATNVIFCQCPESEVVSSGKMFNLSSSEMSSDEFTEIEGDKFLSYHDQAREYYRVENADNTVTKHGSEYWYAVITAGRRCRFTVLEAVAALNDDTFPNGNKYTEISKLDDNSPFINNLSSPTNLNIPTAHLKLKTISTINRMCVGLVHEKTWGSTTMVFAHFTDGHTHFEHPDDACGTEFGEPTEQIIYYQFTKTAHDFSSSAKVAGSEVPSTAQFNVELKPLHIFHTSIGEPTRPEYDSLGFWYKGNALDITVEDVWSCEPITRTEDQEHETYRMSDQTRYFTKIGDLSTTPLKVVARLNGFLGSFCGGVYFEDMDAKPHLLASQHSNGDVVWAQTRGSCTTFNNVAIIVTLRAQKLTDSVKVGFQKDEETEMVYKLSSNEEWFEHFNLIGFVYEPSSSLQSTLNGRNPTITFEIIENAEDMTDLATSACKVDCECRSNEFCDNLNSLDDPPTLGKCAVMATV